MHFAHLLSVSSLLTPSILPTTAVAKCCFGLGCGDGTSETPCCGWKKCKVSCCFCEGTQVAPWAVTVPWGKSFYLSTTMLTAPTGVTWHCRDNMERWITRQPTNHLAVRGTMTGTDRQANATATALAMAQAGIGPMATASPAAPYSEYLERQGEINQCEVAWARMSKGTGQIDLESYMGYFNTSLLWEDIAGEETEAMEKRKAYREMLINHFGKRDVDGDGFLSWEEADALM